jgi:hypothetical protein
VCRPAAGPCDAAESCTGTGVACPADGALPDADADGLCDAVDPCTNVAGGRTFALTNPVPKVVVNKINTDTIPDNDHLVVAGAFHLPAGRTFAELNPLVKGARVVLRNRLNGTELDVTIPGGAYGGAGTRGWRSLNTGKKWMFTDSTTSPANGIIEIEVIDRNGIAPRRVDLTVTGDDGNYPVMMGDEPVNVSLAVGGQPEAAAGLCGESAFVAADCFYNNAKNQLTCKK